MSDYDGTAVKRFDSTGVFVSNFLSGLSNFEGVAFFPNGDTLIGNGGTRSVKLFDSTGTYLREFIASGAGNLLNPNAVIIRTTATVSIPDPEMQQTPVLFPTVGEAFYVDPIHLPHIRSVTIYTINGGLAMKMDLRESHSWKASGYPEGMYFAVFTFRDGTLFSQNILVRKE